MKEETFKAVGTLKLMLECIRKAPAPLGRWYLVNGDGFNHDFTSLDKNGVDVLLELLNKLPSAEKCLARGGMVRDADGRWCSHGDRVRFRTGRNADYDVSDDWQQGRLYYSVDDGMWYIETEDGGWLRLGANWEEVCRWVYEGGRQ